MEVNEVEDDDPDYDYDYDDDEDEGEECPNCGEWVPCLECHAEECEGAGPVEGDDSDPEIVNAVTPLETITEPTAGTVPTAVADISNVQAEPEVAEMCKCGAELSYTDKAYLDSHPDESRLCHQCWSQINHRI
jgi:hypothetical protein